MITDVIRLVQSNDFKGVSEEVEIAKGKYHLSNNFGHHVNQFRRWWAMFKKTGIR